MSIPKILFRTVPEITDDLTEAWWEESCRLTPGWQHITYRDPQNPDAFPISTAFYDKCGSGAQFAGLLRLEALAHHGGVYIDSDVMLWAPIDALLQLHGFAAWEDQNTIPDAILGFELGHPAVPVMLEEALTRLSDGAWESGPGVTTRNLQGRDDVLLLPPQSFYPFHWNTAAKRRHDITTPTGRRNYEHLRQASPFTFGAHHWRHSWKGA